MTDLKQFATPRQAEIMEVLEQEGSLRKAAVVLGIHHAQVGRAVNAVKLKAARQGFSPEHDMTHVAPDGFNVKGTSTLYDEEGKPRMQWVKTSIDQGRQMEIMRDAIVTSIADYKGSMGKVAPPKKCTADLLNLIPIGDPHFGLYAWKEEAGEDFDTDIARRDLLGGIRMILDKAPQAKTCIVANLGDYFHTDNAENRTSRSGHALDVDSRWAKVARVGIRASVDMVNEARKKHERVIVVSRPGNHDDISGAMLGLALEQIFAGDPRVSVDVSPSPFFYHRFGRCLFGFTHGHTVKPAALGEIMAHDQAADWGETTFRYWHTGHIHTNNSMDCRGWRWESHRTLAAQDAWSHSMGYRSGRDIKSIIYDRDYGEVARNTFDIRMIRSAAA